MTGAEFLMWAIICSGAGLLVWLVCQPTLQRFGEWLDERDAENREHDEPLGG